MIYLVLWIRVLLFKIWEFYILFVENKLYKEKYVMSRIKIIMYHYVRDLPNSRYPKIKGMNIVDFKKQLGILINAYKIISMDELIAAINGEIQLSENSAMLTFDDGYIDNYTNVLPILEENDCTGSFFIPGKTFTEHKLLDVNKIHYILACADKKDILSDLFEKLNFYRGQEYAIQENDELYDQYAVPSMLDDAETIFIKRILLNALREKLRNKIASELFEKYVGVDEEKMAYELYMTEDQVLSMKRRGMYIGLHGYDHYWLEKLSEDEMKKDIDQAINVMSPFMEKDKLVFNYPYGSYNVRVLKYITEIGILLGLTTKRGIADIAKDPLLELPRIDCVDVAME